MEEINVGSELGYRKENKKTVIVTSFIVIIALITCIIVAGMIRKPKIEIIEAHLSTGYSSYLGYSAEVYGVIKNITNKELSYVSVEFVIYDASGNNLGTAWTNIANFSSGDTWRFTAVLLGFSGTVATSFRVGKVTIW